MPLSYNRPVLAAAVLLVAVPAFGVVPVTNGLVQHLDATTQTVGSLSTWTAETGTNATTLGIDPTVVADGINGRRSVRFGGAQALTLGVLDSVIDATPPAETITLFIVSSVKDVTDGTVRVPFGADDGFTNPNTTRSFFVVARKTGDIGDGYTDFNFEAAVYDDGTSNRADDRHRLPNLVSGEASVLGFIFDGGATDALVTDVAAPPAALVDESVAETGVGTPDGMTLNGVPFLVGARNNGGSRDRFFDGDIGEILLYNRALATSEYVQVENYLAAKWGIAGGGGANPPVTHNLLIALDGADVATTGSSVARWKDQAALGGFEDFTIGDSPILASATMPNGTSRKVVQFNGSTDFLELGADADLDTNAISWFVVTRSRAMTSTDVFLRSACSSGAGAPAGNETLWGCFVKGAESKFVSHTRNLSNSFTADGPVGTNDQWVLLEAVWNGTAGALNGNGAEENFVGAFDATGQRTFSMIDTGMDGNPSGHLRTRLGKDSDASERHYEGDIAEVLVYNTALGAADRELVESYLLNKYLVSTIFAGTVIQMR